MIRATPAIPGLATPPGFRRVAGNWVPLPLRLSRRIVGGRKHASGRAAIPTVQASGSGEAVAVTSVTETQAGVGQTIAVNGTGFVDGQPLLVDGISASGVRTGTTLWTVTVPAGVSDCVLVDVSVAGVPLADAFTTEWKIGADEPVDPGSGYLWEDDFDRYASVAAMTNDGNCDAGDEYGVGPSGNTLYGQRTTANASTTEQSCNPTSLMPQYALTTGRGGSGQALRAIITAGGEKSCGWLSPWGTLLADYTVGTNELIAQIWFRVESGAIGASGCKWFELWDTGNLRVQFSVNGGAWNAASGNYGTGAGWPDSGSTGKQPVEPYPEDCLTGRWFRCTMLIRTNTTGTDLGSGVAYASVAESARDGRMAMWINGTKIVDVSQATVGVTPAGGTKEWCSQAMVDTIPTLRRTYCKFPDVFNAEASAFTLDHDHLKLWPRART